jgi:anti-anti-sigma regulatory factor
MQARHPNSDWLTCEPIDASSSDNGDASAHGGVVLRPLGDLNDAKKVKQFYRACETLINQRVERVVLDLSGVDKVDTKLLAAMVVLRRKAIEGAVDLRVYTSPSVYEWLQVCRIDQLIDHKDAHKAGPGVVEGAA